MQYDIICSPVPGNNWYCHEKSLWESLAMTGFQTEKQSVVRPLARMALTWLTAENISTLHKMPRQFEVFSTNRTVRLGIAWS